MSIVFCSEEVWPTKLNFKIILDSENNNRIALGLKPIICHEHTTVAVTTYSIKGLNDYHQRMIDFLNEQKIKYQSMTTKYGLAFIFLNNNEDLALLKLATIL